MTTPLITIVTPTTNSKYLKDNLESVKAQTYPNIQHLVVGDGIEINPTIKKYNVDFISLPYNTGANGYNGHRIYGATIFLAKGEYIVQLDEDDWFEPTHIESLYNTIVNEKVEWSYSLRKIHNSNGSFVCLDSCESLGKYMSILADNLVGVGSMMLPLAIALRYSFIWHRPARIPGIMEVDRALTKELLYNHTSACSFEHTMCYRMGNTQKSVQAEFFLNGNKRMMDIYNNQLPWLKTK